MAEATAGAQPVSTNADPIDELPAALPPMWRALKRGF